MSWLVIAAAAAVLAPHSPEETVFAAEKAPATVKLTASALFELARRAEQNGDSKLAERAYEALARDPDRDVRAEAMFRHGRLLAGAGNLPKAAVLLRRVVDDRPNAMPVRLELAALLDRMGDKEAAWRQVRAVQASPMPAAVARMVDRFSQALRAARPMGASFELAVAPDTNISRSTSSDTLGTVLGDFAIDEDSRARSGVGVAVRGQAYRRLELGNDARLLLRVAGSADLYAKPRFNDLALDFAAGPELDVGRNRIGVELGASQRWYGQEPHVRSVRVGAALTRPLGRRSQLRAGASASLIDNRLNDLQDGKGVSTAIGIERALSATTGVALSLSGDRLSARDPAYSTTAWRAGAFAWRDVGRATVTMGAEYGRLRADDRLALLPEARSDRFTRFTIGATFRQLSFGGFAPVTRIVIERNRSNIAFHDYNRTRTEIGIVRAF